MDSKARKISINELTKDLLRTANCAATGAIYMPLSTAFPELREIERADMLEYFNYFTTISIIGFTFMEIADSFKVDRDIDEASIAIQKILNDWKERPFESNNYDIMCNFLDTSDELQKQGLPFDVSIGAWIWINLNGSKKAT